MNSPRTPRSGATTPRSDRSEMIILGRPKLSKKYIEEIHKYLTYQVFDPKLNLRNKGVIYLHNHTNEKGQYIMYPENAKNKDIILLHDNTALYKCGLPLRNIASYNSYGSILPNICNKIYRRGEINPYYNIKYYIPAESITAIVPISSPAYEYWKQFIHYYDLYTERQYEHYPQLTGGKYKKPIKTVKTVKTIKTIKKPIKPIKKSIKPIK
jgi:hypothetical protein